MYQQTTTRSELRKKGKEEKGGALSLKRLFHDNKNRTSQKQSQQLVLTNLPNLSEAHRKILNLIISLSNRYVSVYARQSTIAKYSGYCRQYVNEIINDLKEWGYMDTWYRHMTSCVYYINPIFNEGIIRRKYASIFPALALFTISWLKAPDRETTQLSLFNYYIYLTNCSVPAVYSLNKHTTETECHSTKKIVIKDREKKAKESMKYFKRDLYGNDPLSPAAKQLKFNGIRLSKWALMKLSAFPDECIQYLKTQDKQLKLVTKDKPFGYIFKCAYDWCSANAIMPDLYWFDAMKDKWQMPDDAPMVEKTITATENGKKSEYSIKLPEQEKINYDNTHKYHLASEEEKRLKREREKQWDKDNAYLIAKKTEEALHTSDKIMLLGIKNNWLPQNYNTSFTQLTIEQQQEIINSVHGMCNCQKDFLSPVKNYNIDLDTAKKNMYKFT